MDNSFGRNQNISSDLNVFDLQSLRRFTNSTSSKDASLKEASEQFEGIFIRQLLASMRKVNDLFKEDNLFDSSTSDFYQGMWDDQIATSLSSQQKNSSSISSLMMQQLSNGQSQKKQSFVDMASTVNTSIKTPGVINPVSKIIVDSKLETKPLADDLKLKSSIEQVQEPESFSTREQFIEFLYPLAKQAAEKIGGSAKALLAQAALETGWGKHIINDSKQVSSKNLFNIKDKADWNGEVAYKKTVEFDGEQFNLEQAGFRVYQNFKESFDDFVKFLSASNRYQDVVKNASNPEKYFNELQRSGYATDPEYATKIQKIFKSELLQNISE